MKQKKPLTEEEHKEMITELILIDSPESARRFHKKYKKYGHGLPLIARYPKLPRYLCYVSILFSLMSIILSLAAMRL